MSIQHTVAAFLVLALTAGCATTSARSTRSEFEDIPVPKGLTYQPSKSTIIESPTVKAARLVYRGRLEVESLALALRTTLEANGWRHVSSTSAAEHGITQVYEKSGSPGARWRFAWWAESNCPGLAWSRTPPRVAASPRVSSVARVLGGLIHTSTGRAGGW